MNFMKNIESTSALQGCGGRGNSIWNFMKNIERFNIAKTIIIASSIKNFMKNIESLFSLSNSFKHLLTEFHEEY